MVGITAVGESRKRGEGEGRRGEGGEEHDEADPLMLGQAKRTLTGIVVGLVVRVKGMGRHGTNCRRRWVVVKEAIVCRCHNES